MPLRPGRWRGLEAAAVCADTPERFRVYLELSHAEAGLAREFLMLADAPGPRLRGIIPRGGAEAVLPAGTVGAAGIYRDADEAGPGRCWRPGRAGHHCAIALIDTARVADRRALAAALQAFAAQIDPSQGAALVLEGAPPDIGLLQDAPIIAGLLGL